MFMPRVENNMVWMKTADLNENSTAWIQTAWLEYIRMAWIQTVFLNENIMTWMKITYFDHGLSWPKSEKHQLKLSNSYGKSENIYHFTHISLFSPAITLTFFYFNSSSVLKQKALKVKFCTARHNTNANLRSYFRQILASRIKKILRSLQGANLQG